MDVAEELDQSAGQQGDESAGQEPAQPDYGPKFLKLPQDRIDQLQSICNKFNLRDQWARQIEILRCTLKRYFWLGLQHVWWNNDSSCFQVGQQGGAVVAEDLNDENTAMQDFNIYKPNGKIFIAAFAQNPASIRMEPDQPKESDSIRASAEAQKYLRVYDKYNPPQDAQITVGRLLWNDGRVVAITEASADGLSEKTRYLGVLETKCPIYETCDELWPYFKASTDHDICTMKAKHPEVASQLVHGTKATSPNDEIARMARISTAESITQLSHDTLQYLVTQDEWWLRPSAFYEMSDEDRQFFVGEDESDEDEDDDPDAPPKQLKPGIFPNGCKVTFCGQTFCGAEAVAMEENIEVMHADPGEGQARNSLGDPHVPVQMEFNDGMNLTAELLKFCIPSLWGDIDETEFAAIREQLAQYGQIRAKKAKPGLPLEQSFFAEPQVEAPMILATWLENLQGPLTQLVTGNQPAMFGGNMEDQKTAKAYAQARDMSLGLLTIVWIPYQTFSAKIHEQAAKIASKREEKFAALVDGKKKGQQETIEIDPMVLRGGFTCSAIPAQGFPESWSTKSQTWKSLKQAAATDSSIAADMQLPDNKVGFHDAIGLPDFVIEGADSRDKQLQEWAEMQKGEGPEQDDEATAQRDQQRAAQAKQLAETVQPGHGQPIPEPPQLPPVQKSSIPIDPDTDDHVAEGMEMFRILNSPEGQKIKNTQDLGDGRNGLAVWTDGKLHMLAHVAAGKAKGLMFPPPLGGPPPMPVPGPPKPGLPGAGAGAPPPGTAAALPPLAAPVGGPNAALPA